jgi:hypothetical protein
VKNFQKFFGELFYKKATALLVHRKAGIAAFAAMTGAGDGGGSDFGQHQTCQHWLARLYLANL